VLNESDGSVIYQYAPGVCTWSSGSLGGPGTVETGAIPCHDVPCGDGGPTAASPPTLMGQGTEERLYRLIRQSGTVTDHSFEIRFLDPCVRVLTFG
jgi:hypothetical protein